MMKKSQIPWCDFTWDPVTGCRRDCAFCIGRKRLTQFKGDSRFYLNDDHIVKNEEKGLFILTKPLSKNGSAIPAPTGFLPTLHPYRLPMVAQKRKPANILVCHSGDLFGEWIPTEWILKVFDACEKAPWHNYLFITMNPKRYNELLQKGMLVKADNFWYGTRITQRSDIFTANGFHTFVLIDPMALFAERIEIPEVEWILLGSKEKLKRRWIDSIMDRKRDIPVFMIESKLFNEAWGSSLIQEYPEALYRPKEKALPHCSECKYCHSKQQGNRGQWRVCKHSKIIRQDKNHEGRHIDGRYAKVSPQWCPKRTGINWRIR